jgi:hypothetical protein
MNALGIQSLSCAASLRYGLVRSGVLGNSGVLVAIGVVEKRPCVGRASCAEAGARACGASRDAVAPVRGEAPQSALTGLNFAPTGRSAVGARNPIRTFTRTDAETVPMGEVATS